MPYNRNTNRKFNNDMVAGINQYLQSEQCKNDRQKQATNAKTLLPKNIDEKELLAMGKYFTSILDGGELVIASEEIDDTEKKHYEEFMAKSSEQLKDLHTPPTKKNIAHASNNVKMEKDYAIDPNELERLNQILANTPSVNIPVWEHKIYRK